MAKIYTAKANLSSVEMHIKEQVIQSKSSVILEIQVKINLSLFFVSGITNLVNPVSFGFEDQINSLYTSATTLIVSSFLRQCYWSFSKTMFNNFNNFINILNQAAQLRLAGCLQKSTEVMKSMQQLVKLPEIQKTMMEMSKEMMKVRSNEYSEIYQFIIKIKPGGLDLSRHGLDRDSRSRHF